MRSIPLFINSSLNKKLARSSTRAFVCSHDPRHSGNHARVDAIPLLKLRHTPRAKGSPVGVAKHAPAVTVSSACLYRSEVRNSKLRGHTARHCVGADRRDVELSGELDWPHRRQAAFQILSYSVVCRLLGAGGAVTASSDLASCDQLDFSEILTRVSGYNVSSCMHVCPK